MTRADIIKLIHVGLSNGAIARQTGVTPKTVRDTRQKLGLPPSTHGYPPGLTLEQTWQARTQPTDDGHLRWTGSHNSSGVPGFQYHGRWHSARAVAFRLRTGRDPVGYCKAGCGQPWCVAPEHVDDEQNRQHIRAAMRALLGMPTPPQTCPAGHDQAVHGRIDANHKHYCGAGNRAQIGRAHV